MNIEAALNAERDYLAECDERRRERSLDLYAHPGAYVSSAAPSDAERVKRMVRAANGDVHVEQQPSGAQRIIVSNDESDSLAVLTVERRYQTLTVEVGLRGNFDAKRRPMRRTYVTMPAPDVSPDEFAQRKTRAAR